ncbi:hypothetical protein D9M68_756170 [compost metagenome]
MFCWLSQRVSQPVRQCSQQPHAVYSQGTPTRSPSLTRLTPAPTAATKPTPSWPGMKGRLGFTGQSPSAACRSVWQTPEASIFTRICPGPGRGTFTSSIRKGSPKAWTTAAFMVWFMALTSLVEVSDSAPLDCADLALEQDFPASRGSIARLWTSGKGKCTPGVALRYTARPSAGGAPRCPAPIADKPRHCVACWFFDH